MHNDIDVCNEIIAEIENIKTDGELLYFLNKQKNNIKKQITKLNEELDWSSFNISFYGETNAGKSTLIEALRLYFEEETKLQNHKKIDEIKEKITLNQEEINNNNSELQSLRLTNTENNEKIKTIESIDKNILKYVNLYYETKNPIKAFYYYMMFSVFFVFKKQKLNKDEILKIQEYHKTNKNLCDKIKSIESNNHKIDKLINQNKKELNKCIFDGDNIGTETDLTKISTKYNFNFNENNFNIIDMPGIEGDEKKVKSAISEALRKSHVVFYVVNKTEEKTLEKIKLDLDTKAEVYTIRNVRTKSPKGFKGLEISSIDDDIKSKVKNVLQDNYNNNHFILSAQMAFLTLSKHLREEHEKEKNKWLESKNNDEILQGSKFLDFTNFLKNDLITNINKKINEANIKTLISFLNEIAKNNFQKKLDGHINTLKQTEKKEVSALEDFTNLNSIAKNRFNSLKSNLIQEQISNIRRNTYEYISKNHSDKEVEEFLKTDIEYSKNTFTKEIERSVKKLLEEIDKKILIIVEDYKNAIKKLELEDIQIINVKYPELNNLAKDIDSGIEYGRLVGVGVGAISLAWGILASTNPIGWVAIAFGAVGIAINALKSIMKFFSVDYKMKEQRKAVDKHLCKIKDSLDEQLDNYYKSDLQESIKKQIENIKNNIISVRQKIANECVVLEKIINKINDINKELLCKIQR